MKDARDLSPEETVEALRLCSSSGGVECDPCPLCGVHFCYRVLITHAADVLDELSREYDSMAKTVCEMSEHYSKRRAKERST